MEFYAQSITRPMLFKGNSLVVAVYGILYLLINHLYGGHQVGYLKKGDLAVSGLLTIVFTNAITYLQTCLVGREIMWFPPFIGMTLAQMAVLVVWANVSGHIYAKAFPPYELLLIEGGTPQTIALVDKLASRPDRYKIKETIGAGEGIEAITDKIIAGYGAVILCDLPARMRNLLLKFCFEHSIVAYTTPKISDILIRGGQDITLFDTPLLLSRNLGLSLGQRFLKRLLDLTLSLLGLAVFSPLMLAIAIAIKRGDGGPVIFRQTRCTIGNRPFSICKFRSMVVNAGDAPAIDHDIRITPVGRLLRATRLDELPQLLNVVKGDMSLVGPRPEMAEHVERYTRDLPEFVYRAKVKAGLTGYAQIVGKYNTSARDKLLMDLMYITNYSFWGDVKLILMTLKIIFFKDSTEGFRPGEGR